MILQQYQNNALASAVKAARSSGRFPVYFSGGCNSSIRVVGSIDHLGLGMFWFDAHADDNTPVNSQNGMFEGMPVSIIAGECWKAWREKIKGFHVIPSERISQVGLYDRSVYVEPPGRRDGVGNLVDPAAVKRRGIRRSFPAGLGSNKSADRSRLCPC